MSLIRYPLPSRPPTRLERWMVASGWGFARCTVCGSFAGLKVEHEHLRDTCRCRLCWATNRQRQLAYVCCRVISARIGTRVRSLPDLARVPDLAIYNTEAGGPIHARLSGSPGYTCSEYLDPAYSSGSVHDGILHQDLMALSFPDERFDLVISADVFEHIPEPYAAHAEIYRVLKRGGHHVFTVPFYQEDFLDETRAVLEAGTVVHLQDPLWHEDPLHPETGILVYTIFSLEMLTKLRRLGFITRLYQLYSLWYGFHGFNAIVFDAVKPAAPSLAEGGLEEDPA